MSKQVKVYSTQTCPYCVRAKQFLQEHNIPFENIDVSVDHAAAEEMVKISGQMGVPVLDIEGTVIVGFDKEKIQQTLGI